MRTRNAWWSVWESDLRTSARLRFVFTAIMAITPTPARRMATMGLIGLRMASLSALAHGSMGSTGVRMDITAEATTAVTITAAATGVGTTAADTTADADLKADAVSAGAMAVDSMVAAAFTAVAVFTEAAVSMEEAASTAMAAIVN